LAQAVLDLSLASLVHTLSQGFLSDATDPCLFAEGQI